MTEKYKSIIAGVAKISDWQKEYDTPGYIEVIDMELKSVLGYTIFHKDLASIRMNNVLLGSVFAYTSTLWHEYCHAELWLKGSKNPGHTNKWIKLMARKPWYVIGCVYSQFYYKLHKKR